MPCSSGCSRRPSCRCSRCRPRCPRPPVCSRPQVCCPPPNFKCSPVCFRPKVKNYSAHLNAEQEALGSLSCSKGKFCAQSCNGNLSLVLSVSELRNVTAAHLHWGKPGVEGPIVVTLFQSQCPVPCVDGVLVEGFVTDANLQGPLAGQSLCDLLNLMDAGFIYVNVHTTKYPLGAIRGQIHRSSKESCERKKHCERKKCTKEHSTKEHCDRKSSSSCSSSSSKSKCCDEDPFWRTVKRR